MISSRRVLCTKYITVGVGVSMARIWTWSSDDTPLICKVGIYDFSDFMMGIFRFRHGIWKVLFGG